MITDRLSCASFLMSDPQILVDRALYRQNVLDDIEAALTKARVDAEAIEHSTLAYFIDMAIAEIRSLRADDEGPAGKDD